MAKRPTKVQKNPHLHIISEEIFLVNKSKFQTTSGMSKEAYKIIFSFLWSFGNFYYLRAQNRN